MTLKSRFTFRVIFPPIFILIFLVLTIHIICDNWPITVESIRWIDIYVAFLFCFIFIYLFFNEIRRKSIMIEITDNYILVKNFLGLSEIYKFIDLDGFQTSTSISRAGTFEYLYIIKKGKRQIVISSQYHKNYKEIKTDLENQAKNLGNIKFSIWTDIKETFD